MLKSPFTPVSIPEISLHDAMLHCFEINTDKKALVGKMLLMECVSLCFIVCLITRSECKFYGFTTSG